MLKNKLMLALASLGSVPAIAMADAPAAPADAGKAPVSTLSQVLDASGITATGYLDIGYTNLNSTGLFVSGTPTRVFDAPSAAAGYNADSFNLNQAAITVSKQPKEGFGGVINLTAGQDAKVIASNGTTPGNLDVTQAYASYAGGPVTVIAGKFVTLAGAEVINSPSNTNYSRSILFGYAIPFTHTGARLTFAASDTISLIAGVNNGWDQVSDLNTSKTVELGFTAAPNKMFSLAGVYYGGQEPANLGTNGSRQLYDLVGTINPIDKLSVVLNYDHGSQDNAALANGSVGTGTWDGLAGYLNYQFSDQWRASLRSEYMNDSDGVRLPYVGTAGQKWKETTLTLAYMPTASLELRGEIRGDSSNEAVFLRSDGTANTDQTSFALEALYKF
ncbi:MAG: porin [Gallionellaceae bacterium]